MSSDRRGGRWPGVLLHPDAFLVHAVPSVLAEPPGDLVVHVGGTTRTVAEILLIAEPVVAGRAAGMIRLTQPVERCPAVAVDRAAITRAWADGRPLWSTLLDRGVVPAEWPEPTRSIVAPADRPAAIAVKSVAAGPADWCTIFWWLC